MSKDLPELCGYCGSESPTTRDHISPKVIFPSPRPDDLIAVASSASCNQGASQSDERLRTYLSLHVGVDNATTSKLWDETLRGVRHNRRLRRILLANAERVWLTTGSGVIYDDAYRGCWISDAHDRTIERMIRGLCFHYYREVLGNRARVKTHWFRELSSDLLEVTAECEQRSVGGGQFVYRFG